MTDARRAAPPALVEIETTVASEAEARELAQAAVEERVAACVHRAPIRSSYRWAGTVHDDAEILLVLKTTAARADAAEAWIRARHPYDVPAILRRALAGADPAYAAWVRDEVAPPGDGDE